MMTPIQVSTYDARVTTPRLRGDGMDSDNLGATSDVSRSNSSASNRHRNLKSSTKAATIAKSQAPRFVPREPVKGAVGPSKANSPIRPTKARLEHSIPQSTVMPFSNNSSLAGSTASAPYSSQGQGFGPQQTFGSHRVASQVGISHVGKKQIEINQYVANQHMSGQTEKYSQASRIVLKSQDSKQLNKANISSNFTKPYSSGIEQSADYSVQRFSCEPSLTENKLRFAAPQAPPRLSGSTYPSLGNTVGDKSTDVVVTLDTSPEDRSFAPTRNSLSDTVIDLPSSPPDEERQVEGDLSDSSDEVKTLQQELQDLSKVNTDLKKLLVASVGDDLHWKMDALVRTKTQLATEIGGYTEKMRSDYEELDKLSIQADMWRSKFMATRVLIDQLSHEKEELGSRWMDAQTALQQLLQERQQLQDNMVETHRYIKFLRDSLEPLYARKPASMIPNILELARTNLLLSEHVKEKLLGGAPVLAAALDAGIQNGLSPAEKLAYQVLMSDMKAPSNTKVPGRLSAHVVSKFGRFHPQVRYEGYTFTCCRNCKGDVQVV